MRHFVAGMNVKCNGRLANVRPEKIICSEPKANTISFVVNPLTDGFPGAGFTECGYHHLIDPARQNMSGEDLCNGGPDDAKQCRCRLIELNLIFCFKMLLRKARWFLCL